MGLICAWRTSGRIARFFNGTSLYLRIHGQENAPCEVTLIAPPKPVKWNVYTSLPESSASRLGAARHGFGNYRAENYDALLDHPVEMGTPQVIKFNACGAEHELVFTGEIPNLDLKRIRDDVKRICETQIRFFEPQTARAPFLDTASRYVFMTMVTGNDYGGLEHRASTALVASRKDLPTLGQAKHLRAIKPTWA